MADVDEQAAHGHDARKRGKTDHRDIEIAREVGAVQRPRPAEDHEREVARVVPAADRDELHGIGHVGGGDADDGIGGLRLGETERLADPVHDRRARSRRAGLTPPSSRLDAEPAEQHVGVRVLVDSLPPVP
ncbi:MAG: hypothetical protein R3D25_20545 [Geminicoccaceae bacterium]